MAILDNYDEVDGFENVGDWEWLSHCGHYKIVQYEEEQNYCGFDLYFNSSPEYDQHDEPLDWTTDAICAEHIPNGKRLIFFVLDELQDAKRRHMEMMKEEGLI